MIEEKEALTERELEVVRAVATGATNQQIALDLVISVNTVKVHLKNIFVKLDIQSRTEVALYAVKAGLVEVERPVAAEDQLGVEAAPVTREPISWRKRVLLVATVIFAAMLVVLPRVEMSSVPATGNEFLDVEVSTAQGGTRVQLQRWDSLAPLRTPRSRLAAVNYHGMILVIGGDTSAGTTGAVEEYDPSTDSWRARASKPTPVNNVGAALMGGKVYVPGGFYGEEGVVAVLEIYDPEADAWETGTPMPVPLCAYAIAAVDGKLYVFGGWNGSVYLASTLEYDPLTETWSEKTPMASPRGFASAGAIDGKIYVVGGYDGQREFATVEEYDPSQEGLADPWRQRAPMSMRRGGLGVATIAGTLYVIGGGWNRYLAFNERYDPRSDQWSALETPVSGQWRNLAVVAGDTGIYALGGWNGDFLDANYEYQALFTYYLPEVP
ncbi:MAG TPA: LuxR C-terminal-related transcriptional regulator [Anaerolineae bacterium]|nr:LuxR C-terminal-related transcriptional regulator [Anaerolineae bacterium]